MAAEVVELGDADLDRVLELVGLALPDEALVRDDLDAITVDALDAVDEFGMVDTVDVGAVDAAEDVALVRCAAVGMWGVLEGDQLIGAAVASAADVVGHRSAHLQLLVVHPARRRRGVARALVAAFEQWAAGQGVHQVAVGAGAPFYLFTGVDTRWTDALCCFEALGYDRAETELDLVCATAAPRAGAQDAGAGSIAVGHVEHDRDGAELRAWVRTHYPQWQAELDRAAAQGTVVLARDADGRVLGAAAHSVSRTGVIGPVAVHPEHHRRGIGVVLMRAVLADLAAAGLRQAEIAWTSTVRFYAQACGARVGRASVVLRKPVGSER